MAWRASDEAVEGGSSALFTKFDPIELTSTADGRGGVGSVASNDFLIPVLPSGSELTINIMSNW